MEKYPKYCSQEPFPWPPPEHPSVSEVYSLAADNRDNHTSSVAGNQDDHHARMVRNPDGHREGNPDYKPHVVKVYRYT